MVDIATVEHVVFLGVVFVSIEYSIFNMEFERM